MNNWNISVIEWFGLWLGLWLLLMFIHYTVNRGFKGNSQIEISEN